MVEFKNNELKEIADRAKIALGETPLNTVESDYVMNRYPEILKLAGDRATAFQYGANTEGRHYSTQLNILKEEAELLLRGAQIDVARQKLLEALVYFSDLDYSVRFEGAGDAESHYQEQARIHDIRSKLDLLSVQQK